jgi:hypothetical protein
MSDKEVVKLHEGLHFQTTKIPKIMLQRAEKMFPALKEGTVSVVRME